jgi:regulator of sigma E protease
MLGTFLSICGALIALGFMVLIHEFGHFLVARYFDVRVDVFSIGFGTRLFGVKRGPTDYRVSILPLGGYVRMAGDNISEERTGSPDEFLSKPRWQRALIALAGPVMNVIAAIVIMAIHFGGVQPPPPFFADQPVSVAGVFKGSPAERAGIQPGDKLVEINGTVNPNWDRARWESAFALPGAQIPVTIDRDGQTVSTLVTASQDEYKMFGYPVIPAVIETVTPNLPAERAGLKPGDKVLSYDGVAIGSWYQLTDLIMQRHDHPVPVVISRNGHVMNLVVRSENRDPGDGAGARWSVGVGPHIDTVQKNRGVVDSIGFSLWFNQRLARQMLDLVGQLFVGKVSLKEVQGPVGIVSMSGKAARAGFGSLMSMMALISLNLAVVNLLPFPILDGGHITMLAIEGALRHDLSIKAKERFIQVGFVFILVVFALVMYNDVLRLFQHS